MANHGGLLADPVGSDTDQPLLHGQQLRRGPAALLHRPLRHHRDCPVGQEPVGQPLEFGSGGAGQLTAQRGQYVLAGEGGRGRG